MTVCFCEINTRTVHPGHIKATLNVRRQKHLGNCTWIVIVLYEIENGEIQGH